MGDIHMEKDTARKVRTEKSVRRLNELFFEEKLFTMHTHTAH